MPSESNTSPSARKLPSAEILNTWLGVAAILVAVLTLIAQIRSEQNADIREIRQLIQANESGRQEDARSLNARVDAADARQDATDQLILAASPYRCPSIS